MALHGGLSQTWVSVIIIYLLCGNYLYVYVPLFSLQQKFHTFINYIYLHMDRGSSWDSTQDWQNDPFFHPKNTALGMLDGRF